MSSRGNSINFWLTLRRGKAPRALVSGKYGKFARPREITGDQPSFHPARAGRTGINLERFFDWVNHNVLMARVARLDVDKRVLRLICRYLEAGLMPEGVTMARSEGAPQGAPLSAAQR